MTTGQRIKAARKKAGMTQMELADKLGIPYQSISQWERDTRNPKYDSLQRIAAALGVDWTELVPEKEHDLKIFDSISERLVEEYPGSKGFSELERTIVELGGFDALFKFGYLSDEEQAEALRDIKNFIEFTLSKYDLKDLKEHPHYQFSQIARQDITDSEPAPQPPTDPQEGTDTA